MKSFDFHGFLCNPSIQRRGIVEKLSLQKKLLCFFPITHELIKTFPSIFSMFYILRIFCGNLSVWQVFCEWIIESEKCANFHFFYDFYSWKYFCKIHQIIHVKILNSFVHLFIWLKHWIILHIFTSKLCFFTCFLFLSRPFEYSENSNYGSSKLSWWNTEKNWKCTNWMKLPENYEFLLRFETRTAFFAVKLNKNLFGWKPWKMHVHENILMFKNRCKQKWNLISK